LTDVEGSGLVVHLRHSPRVLKGVDRATLKINDQDVNAVLNALRLGGAEALAISDARQTVVERILALSAAGPKQDGIVVNGTMFTMPLRIYAVGDAAMMRVELLREGGVVKKADLDTLQMIEFETASILRIPASRTAVSFKFARSQTPDVRVASTKPLLSNLLRTQPSQPDGSLRPRVPGSSSTGASPSTTAGQTVTEPDKARPMPAEVSLPRTVIVRRPPAPPRPEKDKPVTGSARPQPAPEVATAAAASSYFGGKELAKFHLAGCRFGERIEKGLRVSFTTPDAARKAGRIPCKICMEEPAGS
jgi:hypothetical protein